MGDACALCVCHETVCACSSRRPTVLYVHSPKHLFECNRLPRVRGRSLLVHGLIEAYELLPLLLVSQPTPATDAELKRFHSEDYVDFLRSCELSRDLELEEAKAREYNLVDDCPLVERLYTIVRYVAGGTLTAARALIDGSAAVAIHWAGGWHHGQRSEAAGFCYVNDVVLGIQELYVNFGRVLYVDLDVHHGDGVQEAFCATNRVLTVSFHNHEPGFYPGTGSLVEDGYGRGKGYSLNVPLRSGIKDDAFISVVTTVLEAVLPVYQPNAIVCQCGVDGLSGDPLGSFNLTPRAFVECLQLLLSKQIPLLVLGGGGYVPENAARCWTQLTATMVGKELDDDIPEHKFFLKYGPGFELGMSPGCRQDRNDSVYLNTVMKSVLDKLSFIWPPEPILNSVEKQHSLNGESRPHTPASTKLQARSASHSRDGEARCPYEWEDF